MISAHPESWYFFLILPPVILLLLWKQVRGRKLLYTLSYGEQNQLHRNWITLGFIRSLSFILFLIMLILALYDFHWGIETESKDQRGNDIALVLDVSYSMMAKDSLPTRLESSKESLLLLLGGEDNNRFSFIPFKGAAITAVPLTEDKVVLENYITLVNPTWISSPGSNMEEALREALLSLESNQDRNKMVVLATDGEQLSGNALRVIREWIPKDINLLILGAGETTPVQVELAPGDWLTDSSGNPVETRLEKDLLEEMVKIIDGDFIWLNDRISQMTLQQKLEDWGQPNRGIRYYRPEKYKVFLIPALFFLWFYNLMGRLSWAKKYW